MRFVALSATLPNAADFGVFLRAEVFRFGAEYRPVQLHVRFWWIRLGTFCQLGFTSPAFRKVLLWAASEEINSHILRTRKQEVQMILLTFPRSGRQAVSTTVNIKSLLCSSVTPCAPSRVCLPFVIARTF